MQGVSVIVCALNEESRLARCLDALAQNQAEEIILVDGGSTDGTLQIAKSYANVTIVHSDAGSLTSDRAVGIAHANSQLICFIDADHIVKRDTIQILKKELLNGGYSALQAQLRAPGNTSLLCKGEDQWWQRFHNNPGRRTMIGVAPTIYQASFFEKLPFSSHITTTIDDTDLFYRAELLGNMSLGIATDAVVLQSHKPSLAEYLKKFWWYGVGDGEFIAKYPRRALKHIYHLTVRYPLIYMATHARSGELCGALFTFLQGITRAIAAFSTLVKISLSPYGKSSH